MAGKRNSPTWNLPPLPEDCPELTRTGKAPDNHPLDKHLEALPGLTRTHLRCLEAIATSGGEPNVEPVLGVADLLRRRRDASHALHPRVIQLLPVAAVDPLLTKVATQVDARVDYRAYQYPGYLAACQTGQQARAAFCPSVSSIDVVDVVRDLRANDVLTAVCQPGHPRPDTATLARLVETMERAGEVVEGVATLVPALNDSPRDPPTLLVEDRGAALGRRSPAELLDLCETLKLRFQAHLALTTASESLESPHRE